LRLSDLGERITSPTGPGQSLTATRILGINLHPAECLMANNYLRLLSIKKVSVLYLYTVIHCPGLDLERAQFESRLEGNCNFFGGRGNPAKGRLE